MLQYSFHHSSITIFIALWYSNLSLSFYLKPPQVSQHSVAATHLLKGREKGNPKNTLPQQVTVSASRTLRASSTQLI